MATITNAELRVGRSASSGLEFAEVEYDANFTPTEIRLEIPFRELIALVDRDGQLDSYYETAVQGAGAVSLEGLSRESDPNTADDRVALFRDRLADMPVVWATAAVVHRAPRRVERDFGRQESGAEEYRAFIYLRPEVSHAWNWTNELSANLG